LARSISLKNHPELFRLLQEGETLDFLQALPPEQILMRWSPLRAPLLRARRRLTPHYFLPSAFCCVASRARARVNFQLERAGSDRRIKNFGKDLADSEVYSALLHQVSCAVRVLLALRLRHHCCSWTPSTAP
jgi:plastin-1